MSQSFDFSGVFEVNELVKVEADFVVVLDHQNRVDKSTILSALARGFGFPDYFGHNWDAAYDCLLDVFDGFGQIDVLLKISPSADVNEAELNVFIGIMRDVIESQPTHKRLRIFLMR